MRARALRVLSSNWAAPVPSPFVERSVVDPADAPLCRVGCGTHGPRRQRPQQGRHEQPRIRDVRRITDSSATHSQNRRYRVGAPTWRATCHESVRRTAVSRRRGRVAFRWPLRNRALLHLNFEQDRPHAVRGYVDLDVARGRTGADRGSGDSGDIDTASTASSRCGGGVHGGVDRSLGRTAPLPSCPP